MQTVSTVKHILTTRTGDVAGMVLGDGTIVDMPLGHGETLKAMMKRGDEVRVDGELHRSQTGRLHVQAKKIVMPASRRMRKTADESDLVEAVGRVRKFIYNGSGYINGLRLSDGTVVMTPMQQSEQILAHVRHGDEVRVVGRRRENIYGHDRLVAKKIEILHHDAGDAIDLETANVPERMPQLAARVLDLVRKEKRILKELKAIQRVIAESN
jgi:hypothetical protein